MKDNSLIHRMTRKDYLEKVHELTRCLEMETLSKPAYIGLMEELEEQYKGKRTRYELGLN